MSDTLKELPQYHFTRDDFVNAFHTVFDDAQLNEVFDACIDQKYINGFLLYRTDDEYYIIHLPSGIIVNWYKHPGRTNTCNRPDFTLDDLHAFLITLKSALFD